LPAKSRKEQGELLLGIRKKPALPQKLAEAPRENVLAAVWLDI
jgi:hypothetical protein